MMDNGNGKHIQAICLPRTIKKKKKTQQHDHKVYGAHFCYEVWSSRQQMHYSATLIVYISYTQPKLCNKHRLCFMQIKAITSSCAAELKCCIMFWSRVRLCHRKLEH